MCIMNYALSVFIQTFILLCTITVVNAEYRAVATGYKGCFEPPKTEDTYQINQTLIDNRTISGDICGDLCKTFHPNARYAATKNGYQCFCLKHLVNKDKVSEDLCSTRCLGRNAEMCGGSEKLSVSFISICTKERPCQNQGQCHSQESDRYFCTCKHGFAGENCEDEITKRWRSQSGSRISYMARDGRRSFQTCITFCNTLAEKSKMAAINIHNYPMSWFVNSGAMKKDQYYYIQVEDSPPTECYQMYNGQVTKAQSCDQLQGCLCQTRLS